MCINFIISPRELNGDIEEESEKMLQNVKDVRLLFNYHSFLITMYNYTGYEASS